MKTLVRSVPRPDRTSIRHAAKLSIALLAALLLLSTSLALCADEPPGLGGRDAIPPPDQIANGSDAQGYDVPKEEPLNPEFLDYLSRQGAATASEEAMGGHGLGFIPEPKDLSHMRGQRLQSASGVVAFPALYDLRTITGKLSPIRDQGQCGTCWAFATMGSLESCLRPAEQSWDFSEMDVNCWDGFSVGSCNGGNRLMTTAYLSRWDGPVTETCYPYNPPSCISRPDCAVQKHIQEVIWPPDRGGPLDNDNIKQMIMTYGAVQTSICYDDSAYNPTYHSFYYDGPYGSNHAICIVGWDDNFNRSNFNKPAPGNGAFIMRNSWNTNWGEAGYFYISYYDVRVGADNAMFDNAEATGNYSRRYDYDPLGYCNGVGFGSDTGWLANVFTAIDSESLVAASFYTSSPNSSYEIYVYLDPTTGAPRGGTLASTTTGIIPYPGYKTITLSTPVPLTAGHKFSIVVKVTCPGDYYPIACEYPISGYSTAATANPGESYISGNGSSWQDATSSKANRNVCVKGFTAACTPVAPTSASASPAMVCSGASSTLTANGGSGISCRWYTGSCGGTLVGTGRSISVTPTVTTQYWVRWESGDCGNSTCASTQVTVNPPVVAPTSASASPATICSGTSSTLTAAGGSGASCKWYAGSCGGTLAGTGTTIKVSPTSTTTYYVRWESTSCGNSACATATVTVSQIAVAPTSASANPALICSTDSSTLTAIGGSGGSCKWYSGSCGGTSVGTGTSIKVSPSVTTQYWVRWESAGCGNSACAMTTVTVNTAPVAPSSASASPAMICSGGTSTLTAADGYGDSCKWYTGSCGGTLVGTGTSITVSPGATTTYYARWEKACGSSSCAITKVILNPPIVAPTSVTANPASMCFGGSTTLTANGGMGATCAWYTDSCGGTLVGTGTSISVSPASTMQYWARWETPGCGNSTCASISVVVDEPPGAPTSISASPDTLCFGGSSTLTAAGGSGDTCQWYTDSCSGTPIGTGTSISVSPTSTTTYYARWEKACGASSCATTTVIVKALPVAPTSAGASPATICAGEASTLTANGGSGSTCAWYRVNCGGTPVGTGTSISVSPTSSTTYCVRWENGCGVSGCAVTSVTVNTLPDAPTSASAVPGTVCYGANVTLTAIGGQGDILKWYTNGCGGTPVGAGPSIKVNPLVTTTYFARWESATCGNSACAAVTVMVNPPPTAPSSASANPPTICNGMTTTLTANGGSGSTCAWYTGSCGGTPIGIGTSISVTPTSTTTYYVRWEKDCGGSACAATTVAVIQIPVAPTSATATPATICPGNSATLTATGGSGASCKWYTDSCGGTLVATGTSITVGPLSTTTYYARWETSCGNSTCAAATVTVSPLPFEPTSADASPSVICAGEITTLTVSGGGGSTCAWYSGACGQTRVGTGTSISVSPASTTTYYVHWESSCGESACVSTVVTVNPLPVAPAFASAGPPTTCSGDSVTLTANGGSGDTCKWYTDPTGGTPIGTGASIVVNPISTTTYYSRWETATCGSSNWAITTVSVNPLAVAPASAVASPSAIAAGGSARLTALGGSGDACHWYSGSCGETPVGAGVSIMVSPSSTTTYYARWETANCGNSDCVATTVMVNPLSAAPASAVASPSTICLGGSATLTAVGGSGGTCAWYAGSCGETLIGTGASIVVTPSETATYYARWETPISGNSACVAATVSVSPPPEVRITSPTADSSCWRNTDQVVVSGTAAAACGNIVSVAWSNASGGSGTCTGTSLWKATIPLRLGANAITVTASDTSGRATSDGLLITYVDAQPGAAWSGMAMISVPLIPDSPDPKVVCGFDANNWYGYVLPAGYVGYQSRQSWFDPASSALGRGFWAKFPANGRTAVPCGNIPPQDQPFTIHLSAGWNLIGQPFIKSVKWDRSTVTVVETGKEARALSSASGIIDGPVWGWDASTHAYYAVHDASVVPGESSQLAPWQAYWIKATVDCDLVLPAP